MTIDAPTAVLRVYFGDSDTVHGIPASTAILQVLRELGVAGATVIHGQAGYGSKKVIHLDRILSLSLDLPVVIEAVDSEERLRSAAPSIAELFDDGLITLERVDVLHHRSAAST